MSKHAKVLRYITSLTLGITLYFVGKRALLGRPMNDSEVFIVFIGVLVITILYFAEMFLRDSASDSQDS